MLGSDRSRGYYLEMICADFLARANLGQGNPETLLFSMTRLFRLLPEDQKQAFLDGLSEKSIMKRIPRKPLRLDPVAYEELRQRVLRRDGWRCQACGTMSNLPVHHQQFRSRAGADTEPNLLTLCSACHSSIH